MGITIKCGESIELIQNVLEEIERKMPNVLWATGTSPTSWNPKKADDGGHVALFIDGSILTYIKDLEEYVNGYVVSNHRNNTVISAEDFITIEGEDIKNETDISFLFN